jgi:hypothetical protein
VENLKRLRWLACPRHLSWLCAYVLLLGLKPCLQDKVQKALQGLPTALILVALAAVVLYFVLVPACLREQLKDRWTGGDLRVRARAALAALRQLIGERANKRFTEEALLSARMSLCLAMMSFQSADYAEAERTALDARQALEQTEAGMSQP